MFKSKFFRKSETEPEKISEIESGNALEIEPDNVSQIEPGNAPQIDFSNAHVETGIDFGMRIDANSFQKTRLNSRLCVQEEFHQPWYSSVCHELKEDALRFHRKQWEFAAIVQVLRDRAVLKVGHKGLGFGVGTEPLPSLFAKYGCNIVATDLDLSDSRSQAWTNGNQLLTNLAQLNERNICPPDEFKERVTYRSVDMNDIPTDLRDFDFTWSSCAFEHLGSIKNGIEFYLNQMETLKPGGWAVHTTEYNVASNHDTIDNEGTVLFRKRDIEELLFQLTERGYRPEPINFHAGEMPLDYYVDVAPYSNDLHLKLRLQKFVTTSILIVCQK